MSDIENLARDFVEEKPEILPEYQYNNSGPSWKARLVAAILGLIFAFGLAEFGVRMLGYNAAEQKKTTDVETGLRTFPPNASIQFREACLTNTIVTNSLGFHAREYPIEKPAGVYRIVIVGDSFVEADQVTVDKTYPALLEAKLNARKDGKKYQVIALGVSGNASYANLQYLKTYGLQFKPDLIIDSFHSNDVLADFYRPDNPSAAAPHDEAGNLVATAPAGPTTFTQKIKNYLKSWVKKSNVILLAYSKYLDWQTTRNARPSVSPQATTSGSGAASPTNDKAMTIDNEILLAKVPDFYQKAWHLQEGIFKAFQDTARVAGAKFMIVSMAEAQFTHADYRKEFLAEFEHPEFIDPEMPNRQLTTISKNLGVPYLSVQKSFTQRSAQQPTLRTVWPCDGHYNETGHQWTADVLYDFIMARDLVR